ncbi:MAG: radical SAM family heme chaperone HemW [Caulobacteraceae bacterium]|nr:radical SAM family heme chaperone HemW [Caulobacteraceae bacterium]
MADGRRPIALYVHWPFCSRICPYCDFNVVRDRGREAQKAKLAEAIRRDIEGHARLTGPRTLVSVFFGGGTPSLLDPAELAAILESARRAWTPSADLEVTLETNPADADHRRLEAFATAGVNRLSLGVQSLNDANLKALGRNHDAALARRAAQAAKAAMPRLSLDMIWGLPGQSASAWARDLEDAIALQPEHVSVYELTFEPGTPFDRARERGRIVPPSEDVRAELYDLTGALLSAAGFEAYEVSNHARGEAARSRHNLVYWRGGDYAGVGPGAHGRITRDRDRWAAQAPRGIDAYVEAVGRAGLGAVLERLEPRQAALERLLMGLRTDEGVALEELASLAIDESRFRDVRGLAERQNGRLIATPDGRRVLNALIAHLAR